jgi:hypothetical protein
VGACAAALLLSRLFSCSLQAQDLSGNMIASWSSGRVADLVVTPSGTHLISAFGDRRIVTRSLATNQETVYV